MRRKTIVYFATAVLLGVGMMILPVAIQPTLLTQPTDKGSFTGGTRTETDESNAVSPMDGGRSYTVTDGLAGQPSNLLPSSFILLTGLVVATGVYAALRKRLA